MVRKAELENKKLELELAELEERQKRHEKDN
jgi:hypothetical protein